MSIELHLTPRRRALLLGHDNLLEVLVRAVGPQAPQNAPPKKSLNLALVIDRSGSMSGQPLAEAKRCACAIVDQLAPSDFVSVVTYDSRVEVVCPAQPVANPAAVKAAIEIIIEGGNTALHDGWAAGAEQAAVHHTIAGVSRVLLLSDGCANAGLVDPAAIASHCAQMAQKGVSTSTYGLGRGFNEDLMLAMAQSGMGNGYYGQTAADLMEPFQREFDLLQALYARAPILKLTAPSGIGLEVANDLPAQDGGLRLPDIAYGAEAWAMVRLRIPVGIVTSADALLVDLLTASLAYEVDGRMFTAGPARLALSALPRGAYVAVAEDEVVTRRSQEVRFAEFQQEAAAAARTGDWARVDRVLEKARSEAVGNEWLTASLPALEAYARIRDRERFAKEAAYKSASMLRRLSSEDEDVAYSAVEESARPSFLRRLREYGKVDRPQK